MKSDLLPAAKQPQGHGQSLLCDIDDDMDADFMDCDEQKSTVQSLIPQNPSEKFKYINACTRKTMFSAGPGKKFTHSTASLIVNPKSI